MKIVTVLGARPQFIKAAAVSRLLRLENEEILLHTGQHYDENMSDIFFNELDIPKPNYNLGVGSGSHGKQTADMLLGIEDILKKEKPNCIIVYGDTNSTLAGALAASKLLIPVVHIEAGLRSYNKKMPEEQNRILTDHISEVLFCPTKMAVSCLEKEGIEQNVYLVGDVMCDAVLYYSKQINDKNKQINWEGLKELYGRQEELKHVTEWYLATIHRVENTNCTQNLTEILTAFEELDKPVIFSVHPRTKGLIETINQKWSFKNIFFIKPVGYLDMIYLTKYAKKVITDSGGLQKEAYILNTPCITVREQTEWIETLEENCNVLARPDKEDIFRKITEIEINIKSYKDYYGTGNATKKICEILKEKNL